MSDFGQSFGYRPRPIRLMETQLQLDPQLQADFAALQARIAAREWMDQLLNPRWILQESFFRSLLNTPPPNPLTLPVPGPAAPAYQPGPGPAVPRPGELSDVTGAVYRLPVVQGLVQRAQEQARHDLRQLEREWAQASGAGRFGMVSLGVVFAGSVITPILANAPTRALAFDLIKGKDIPVPLLPGWSFRVLDNGGGVTLPLGNPAIQASGQLQAPPGAPLQYSANVTVDLAALIRGLK